MTDIDAEFDNVTLLVNVTEATQRVTAPVTVAELKTLVRVLPPTYRAGVTVTNAFTADAKVSGEERRYVFVAVHETSGQLWPGNLYVYEPATRQALLMCDHFRGFVLLTQRKQQKIYKTWDALVRDMKSIFGDAATINLSI